MTAFFQNVLTASFQGGIVIAVVLLLRLVLRNAPRKFFCLLWGLAILRLLVPVQISSPVSLQPETGATRYAVQRTVQGFRPVDAPPQAPEFEQPTQPAQTPITAPETPSTEPIQVSQAAPERETDWLAAAAWVWLTVVAGLALYSLISYLRLRHRVREAILLRKNIWESDRIETAFILGYFRPRIYLPMGMDRELQRHILAHERTHLEKGDHWFKLLGFAALTVHWFNPLVWAAYILLCRDIEMACDERVIRTMDLDTRKRYSAALLACSAGHHHLLTYPVAFGEVSVKQRIQRVLRYKKPGFWISIAAILALVFVAVCFLTSPKNGNTEGAEPSTAQTEPVSAMPEHDLSGLRVKPQDSDYVDPYGNRLELAAYGGPTNGELYILVEFDAANYNENSLYGRGVTFTDAYWIEKENGVKWEKLPTLKEPVWTNTLSNLGSQTYSADLNWEELYGPLYDGQYRIGKEIEVNGQAFTYYAQFHVYVNDPAREPEVVAVIDRVNAAVNEVRSREYVQAWSKSDGDYFDGAYTSESEWLSFNEDYCNSVQLDSEGQYNGSQQYAQIDGVNYLGHDDMWIRAGQGEISGYAYVWDGKWGGEYLLGQAYNNMSGGEHICLAESTNEKISLIIDAESKRSFRDYYLDHDGKLTKVENYTYYMEYGAAHMNHTVSNIPPANIPLITSKLKMIPEDAASHTREEWDQKSNEAYFDKEWAYGSSGFTWRLPGWAFYISAENVTDTGLMLYHDYTEGKTKGAVYAIGSLWVEKLAEGKWEQLEKLENAFDTDGRNKLIFDNINDMTAPTRMKMDWSHIYGSLPTGLYRVGQVYRLTTEDGAEYDKTCYTKFQIVGQDTNENLERATQGFTDLLNRENYAITVKIYGWSQTPYPRDNSMDKILKRGGDYLEQHMDFDDHSSSLNLLRDGKGYYSGNNGRGWDETTTLNEESFQFWVQMDFTWQEYRIDNAYWEGSTLIISQQLSDYPMRFEFTFDDDGSLVAGKAYHTSPQEELRAEFTVEEPRERDLQTIDLLDITRPASFSYAGDEERFQYFNVKTEGFKNTEPTAITTAQEATEQAKKECTVPYVYDENGRHRDFPCWDCSKVFFDEEAGIWKVEFTLAEGGVYQAIYMTTDGVTTRVVE